jgi:streptomycin 6-kinase
VSKELNARIVQCAQAWGLTIERSVATPTSVLVYGTQRARRAVLKVVKNEGDEWNCGAITAAFGGRAVVQVYEHVPGAVLLECLTPGTSLATLAQDGRDAEATEILATLLRRMAPLDAPASCPTIEDWAAAFPRYLAGDNDVLPRPLVEYAKRIHHELSFTQRNPSLLHGDFHHYNVLRDEQRGWIAIDPKGVIGELEYDIGAALRNPFERPDLFASLDAVEKRLGIFGEALGIDIGRARGWAFAQAVLATIRSIEDGEAVTLDDPTPRLARALDVSPALRADFQD